MNKRLLRLTENDLRNIVKMSVNKVLNEAYGTPPRSDEANWEAADGNYLVPEGGADAVYKRIGDIKRLLAKSLNMVWNCDEEDETIVKYYDLLSNKIQDCFMVLDRLSSIKSMKLGLSGERTFDY